MIIRARAPLRLGLAGGGSDVSPYSDLYGGFVLNVTIDKYATCNIVPTEIDEIEFIATDINKQVKFESSLHLTDFSVLALHVGVYNKIIHKFNITKPLSFKMVTYSDAPAGSGLGSSSTMVVAMLKAYVEWLNLPVSEYDLAHLAYEVERVDLKLSGGKQDHYAAAFGGFNFIEFYGVDKVVVNQLRIKKWIEYELETKLLLFYTGTSRESAKIIDEQIKNTQNNNQESINATHQIKQMAIEMKEALLKGDFKALSATLRGGWIAKKHMAKTISNSYIEEIYEHAMQNGADAIKVSGAGGGGFMMILCDPFKRSHLIKSLAQKDGYVLEVKFVDHGAEAWVIFD